MVRQVLICHFVLCDLNRGDKYKRACKQKEVTLNTHGVCDQYIHQEFKTSEDIKL